MGDIVLPMWLVVPVGVLIAVGILALPIIVAFLPAGEEPSPSKQSEGPPQQ